jgi:hypothetical protein
VNAKTVAERVQALRQRREALGVTRLELYAHPDDHAALKVLADRLQRKRAKLPNHYKPKETGGA